MPFSEVVLDSLPYVDNDPTPEERMVAQSIIVLEMGEIPSIDHPSLSPSPAINFSPRVRAELERVQNKQPLNAVDLSRYESIDLQSLTGSDLNAHYSALRSVFVSESYLSNREKNLELLNKFGKNAWLLGNSQLESILREVERNLAQKKTDIDICVLERKTAQEAVGGEINELEESWKKAVGRALEAEIAADNLKSGKSMSKTR